MIIKNITLATTNEGKRKEFELAFKGLNLQISSLQEDLKCEEDGSSFFENALQKAQLASKHTQTICLADDSGLCVDALSGAPGIHSARYFANDKGLTKLLQALNGQNNRQAHFVCVLVLTAPDGSLIWHTEKHWHGHIAPEAKGSNGFGYDPIFIPNGIRLTAAELPAIQKNQLSHRALAIEDLRRFIES